ncbi:MAG: cytochrome c [Gemmatimonadota bacterium]
MARRSIALVAVLFASGCNWYYNTLPSPDDLMKLVPWFDHMVKSRAVHPYERANLPRLAPKGSVPIDKGEAEWGVGDPSAMAPQYGFDTTAANRLTAPPLAAGVIERGDTAYHTFCAVCHGPTGAADGTVGPKLAAPSLLTASARGRSDGYLYGMVRYGRGVMPQYGDKVFLPDDRWAVVHYVRKLQADAPAPPPAPPATPVPGRPTR